MQIFLCCGKKERPILFHTCFNWIFYQVHKNHIDVSDVNEEQFIMHENACLRNVNKFVILAMKKLIMVGATKNLRKVEYLIHDDKKKLLGLPNHQSNFPIGI